MKPTVFIDDAAFRKDLASLAGKATGSQMTPAAEAGGGVIEGAAKINVRNNFNRHPTGNLLTTINTKVASIKAHAVTVTVGTNAIYGPIHEFGGTIKVKKKKYLAFVVEGQFVMVKSVYIPPRPFMRPAVDENLENIKTTLLHHLKKLIVP